jgi:hypothetical protein
MHPALTLILEALGFAAGLAGLLTLVAIAGVLLHS